MTPEEIPPDTLETPDPKDIDDREPYAKSLRELGNRYRHLVQAFSILKRMDRADAPRKDIDAICRDVIDAVAAELGATSCSLMLMDEDGIRLRERARRGPAADETRVFGEGTVLGWVFQMGHGIIGEVADSQKPRRIEDLNHSEEGRKLAKDDDPPSRSMLCFPLAVDGDAVGVLTLTHPEPGYFSDETERILSLVAERMARVLSACRLRQKLFEAEARNLHELESLVEERSRDLCRVNEELAREVEEHREANHALRRLATALEQAGEGILVTDAEGIIEYANPAFENITGRESEKTLGRPIDILQQATESVLLRDVMRTVRGGATWRGPISCRCDDTAPVEVEATVSPVLDEAGRLADIVFVIHDMTQERRLEAQLRQAQKMEAIGTLAGGIAHDFNNLLQILVGYLDLARIGLPTGNRVLGRLDQARTAASRAVDLVRQILTFSRKAEQERKPLRLQSLLKESMKLLRGSIPSTIEVREKIASNCGPVLADSTQMQQVLMNLATNAYQAMRDSGGAFTVSLEQIPADPEIFAEHPGPLPEKCVLLSVSDTGPGIDPGIVDRIFEPYFTTKSAGEGTGMGLATVHGIIVSHGGVIRVESAPGEGTTFRIYLPVCGQEGSGSCAEVPDLELLKGNEHILFVDDEQMIGLFIKEALEELGYRVTAHTSSREALEAFRNSPLEYDVVITDQTMPEITGMDLAQQVLDIRPRTPIILCTGYSERVNEEVARARGIGEYFEKPVVVPDLVNAMRRLMERQT